MSNITNIETIESIIRTRVVNELLDEINTKGLLEWRKENIHHISDNDMKTALANMKDEYNLGKILASGIMGAAFDPVFERIVQERTANLINQMVNIVLGE
jgi:hypothetical protein